MVILVGVAAFRARNEYQFVMKHPELRQSPPYNPHVEPAHLFTYVGLITLFPWLFVSSGLIYFSKGAVLFAIGLADLCLAIMTAIGVSLQAQYLPATVKGCSKADVWQVKSTERSFFVLAQELSNRKRPYDSCKTFVSDWQLAFAALLVLTSTLQFSKLNIT
jgi:hypothetical protein